MPTWLSHVAGNMLSGKSYANVFPDEQVLSVYVYNVKPFPLLVHVSFWKPEEEP